MQSIEDDSRLSINSFGSKTVELTSSDHKKENKND